MPEDTILKNVIIVVGISGLEPEPAANIIAYKYYHTNHKGASWQLLAFTYPSMF